MSQRSNYDNLTSAGHDRPTALWTVAISFRLKHFAQLLLTLDRSEHDFSRADSAERRKDAPDRILAPIGLARRALTSL
jgi:hypothetical protein